MLEVIDKGSATESHPVPLLFVHGTWHAAWCWDEHFLDLFGDKGFRAVAVSLRSHGASAISKPLNSVTFADYVDDVHITVDMLGSEPVLIGHSLGGLVVWHGISVTYSTGGSGSEGAIGVIVAGDPLE
jgi:pimeloyl-ACP methyl ester carboxylesterase